MKITAYKSWKLVGGGDPQISPRGLKIPTHPLFVGLPIVLRSLYVCGMEKGVVDDHSMM